MRWQALALYERLCISKLEFEKAKYNIGGCDDETCTGGGKGVRESVSL